METTMTKYTTEKKDQVLAEVEEVKCISVVGRKYGITPSTIHGWIKQRKKKIELQPNAKNKDLTKEIKNLKKNLDDRDLEIAILKDLLKKTTHVLIKD